MAIIVSIGNQALQVVAGRHDLMSLFHLVKAVGHKGQIYELTGTGYKKADWLKEGMRINTDNEPLEELKGFDYDQRTLHPMQ